jgi:hypothetical protein
MINFASVYDLVSETVVASKPAALEGVYQGPVKKLLGDRALHAAKGHDRYIHKTAKGEVVYVCLTEDRGVVVVGQTPQNLTQVRWVYFFIRNVVAENNKRRSTNSSLNQLKNFLEVQSNDVNKAINVAAIFPERRPNTDPTFELEIEKWEAVSVQSEQMDDPSRVAEFWKAFRFEILLGTTGVVLLLIAFVIWHKGWY